MPAELEETVDFAISRTAFRYFDYPDIALKNVVKALAEGGWADIYFSTERSSLYNFESGKTREEQFKESQEYFKKIEELEYGKRRSWEPVQKEKNEMLEKKIAAENKNNQENREKVEKELDKRVRSVLLWIKQLEKEGYIETNIPNEGQTREKKYYRDTDGFFKIKKLKSIKDLSER
jgi:ubiquinone/menaquinone biosynthesis C-methylase UbiE